MGVEFLLLGSVEARRDGAVLAMGGPQQRRLLAVLLSVDGRTLTLDRLEEAVWPSGESPDGASRTLLTYVSRLRAALGDGYVISHSPGYSLDPHDLPTDATRFETLFDTARRVAPTQRVVMLDEALALWRGPAFGEFATEWWARPLATRLDELRLAATEDRIDALLDLGEADRAASDAEGFTRAYPLRERPVAQLARALVACGRQADAMRALHAFRERLADQTGLDPSPALNELEQSIAEGTTVEHTAATRVARGYVLGDVLGEGAFGTVYRATQPGIGREVAVKVIRADLADNPAFVKRFEAEAQLVARLEHPHIVPLHDFWREPGGAFLVFRLMRGGSAEQSSIADGPWPLERVDKLVEQIGGALMIAHASGVVHRDIKPANVLFDLVGNAHLADFGIASTGDDITAVGGIYSAGSPLYASPEQFQRVAASARSDLYSFAAMIWELLTGTPPFDGDDNSTIARLKLERPVPSLFATRPDLAPSVDSVLQKATAPRPVDRYESVAEFLLAWRAAFVQRRSATTHDEMTEPQSPRQRAAATATELAIAGANPYKGLRSFSEADTRDFHGRGALADDLCSDVSASRVTMVVGASGAGKSSLLAAGLIPRLRAGGWRIVTMVPTDRPCAQLETALLSVATAPLVGKIEHAIEFVIDEAPGGLVLVVDQFEELWTLADATERARFIALLRNVICDESLAVRCVCGMRADFFDRPLADPDFGPLVSQHVFTITPMSAAELAEAVRAPANAVGVSFEPGLDAEIVADVVAQSGSLPLLQFALAELYEHRAGAVIPTGAYREMGGVAGAVAARADTLYAGLETDGQRDARRLFTRLVTPGAGAEDTRRRVNRSALPEHVNAVADAFVSHRLLVVDRDPATREPTLDIAHESLLTRWPRLRGWLDDNREQLLQLQHLGLAADEWKAGGRQESDLYRGPRLALLGELDAANDAVLSPAESEFLDASRTAAAEAERRERQSVSRLRRALGVAAIGLVIAVVAGSVAFVQRSRANNQRDAAQTATARANEAAEEADIERLIAQSRSDTGTAPSRALLLAVEAHKREQSLRTAGAIQSALATIPKGTLAYLDGTGPFSAVQYGLDTIAARDGDRIAVWSASTFRRVRTIDVPGVTSITLSTDDHYIASFAGAGVTVYDVATGQPVAQLASDAAPTSVAFDPSDAERLAVGHLDGSLSIRQWRTGAVVTAFPSHTAQVTTISFSGDGALLSSSANDGTVRVSDAHTGVAKTATFQLSRGIQGLSIPLAKLSRSGRFVGAANVSPAQFKVWRVSDGTEVFSYAPTGPIDAGIGVHFLDDDTLMTLANTFERRFDLRTGKEIPIQIDPAGLIYVNAASSPDGRNVAVATLSQVIIRAVDDRQVGAVMSLSLPPGMRNATTDTTRATFNRDGTKLLIADSKAYVYDLTSKSPVAREVTFAGDGNQTYARFGGGGRFIETVHQQLATLSSTYRQWDPDTFEPLGPAVRLPGLTSHRQFASSPDGRLVAAANLLEAKTGANVRVFDVQTGALLVTLDDLARARSAGQAQVVDRLQFNRDGRLLVAVAGGRALLWNLTTNQPATIATRDVGDVNFLADDRLIVRGLNFRFTIHDPVTLQPVAQMSGRGWASVEPHPHPSQGILLSDNGCGNFDAQTSTKTGSTLWDLDQQVEVGVGLALWCSAWSPDGTKFVAMDNTSVQIWAMDYSAWQRSACLVAVRNLTDDEWTKYGPRTGGDRTATCPD